MLYSDPKRYPCERGIPKAPLGNSLPEEEKRIWRAKAEEEKEEHLT